MTYLHFIPKSKQAYIHRVGNLCNLARPFERYAPINVKPEGGTPGICGAFDLFCLPNPREFDLESGPQGGDVCFFFARRTGS